MAINTCSCLVNPTERGAWQAAVHRVTKCRTGLRRHSTHAPNLRYWELKCFWFYRELFTYLFPSFFLFLSTQVLELHLSFLVITITVLCHPRLISFFGNCHKNKFLFSLQNCNISIENKLDSWNSVLFFTLWCHKSLMIYHFLLMLWVTWNYLLCLQNHKLEILLSYHSFFI